VTAVGGGGGRKKETLGRKNITGVGKGTGGEEPTERGKKAKIKMKASGSWGNGGTVMRERKEGGSYIWERTEGIWRRSTGKGSVANREREAEVNPNQGKGGTGRKRMSCKGGEGNRTALTGERVGSKEGGK